MYHEDITDGGIYRINLKKGLQRLDGDKALRSTCASGIMSWGYRPHQVPAKVPGCAGQRDAPAQYNSQTTQTGSGNQPLC